MSVIVIRLSLSSYSSRVVLVLQPGRGVSGSVLDDKRGGQEMVVGGHGPFTAVRLTGFRGGDRIEQLARELGVLQ
jgi:hypothetical protein